MSQRGSMSFKEVAAKYPDVPRLVIRKIDAGLRGVAMTDRAMERARESNSVFEDEGEPGGERAPWKLGGGTFRDGSSFLGSDFTLIGPGRPALLRGGLVPYSLDIIGEKLMLVDGEEPVEEVYLDTIPDYYGKKTSRGTPMHHIVHSDSDCLKLNPHSYCQAWSEGQPCKFCFATGRRRGSQGPKTDADLEDIYETVSEALKEPGRWTEMHLVAGSDPAGATPYENEANSYIAVLKTLKRCFGGKGLPVRLVSSAFPEKTLVRLREAGAAIVGPNLEVWDEKLFEWICPFKAKYFGRQYWIDSLVAAVKVFGRGNVRTQWVGGAEMAQPYGFKTMDEAVASTLEGTEFLARHGVSARLNILRVRQDSAFYGQKQAQPSLEYCVKLSVGIRDIRRKYGLGVALSDYRSETTRPDVDLSRLDLPDVVA
ncbi:MAG: radical SAM protein [Chloroflexi bacterium]|nr:radical SAM protein [Chloroflexota bacterium]